MLINKDRLITPVAIIATVVLMLLINWVQPAEQKFLVKANPQEVLICGPHVGIQAYVTDYSIENEYVIDLEHGGVYNVWHCRAFKGEMKPTGNGR